MPHSNPLNQPEHQPEGKYTLGERVRDVIDFYRFSMKGYDTEIPEWAVVPKGYSSKKNLVTYIKVLIGERDPTKLYTPLRKSNK